MVIVMRIAGELDSLADGYHGHNGIQVCFRLRFVLCLCGAVSERSEQTMSPASAIPWQKTISSALPSRQQKKQHDK